MQNHIYFRLATFALLLPCLACPSPAAAASPVLDFDEAAALAANGPIPGSNGVAEVTPLDVCGSATKSYLAELINTPPSQVKVIDHWADIVAGREMMVAGIVHNVSVGGTDLPFDHPFSGDMNFNLELDPAFQNLAKQLGSGTDPDEGEGLRVGGTLTLHVELEVGMLPHDPAQVVHGPLTGEPWDVLPGAPPQSTLNEDSNTGLRAEYIPQEGDRVAVMGRWILDCGHASFHAELHPVTFMAFGHSDGTKTVVHMLGNPYRSTQRYTENVGGIGANNVNDGARAGKPFPSFLASEVLDFVLQSRDHIEAPVLLEATHPRPVAWKVCAPASSSGRYLHITSSFVKRPRTLVRVQAARDDQGANRCARVTTQVGKGYVAQNPPLRQCTLPWDWLNAEAAIEGGLTPGFDLRPYIKDAIDQGVPPGALPQAQIDAAKARVDNNPTSACFDPLSAPSPSSAPAKRARRWHKITARSDQPFPFYGTIEVSMGN